MDPHKDPNSEGEGEPNRPSSSIWGDWGGFLSSAAEFARSAYDSNVKPALQSMEQTTSQLVQEITQVIDNGDTEGEEAPQEGENVEVSPVKPMSSYPSPPPANHEEQDSEEAEDESLFGDAASSFAYLGGLVQKIGSKLSDVEAVEKTILEGGNKIASALDSAYHFITEEEDEQQQRAGQEANADHTIMNDRHKPKSSETSSPASTLNTNDNNLATPTKAQYNKAVPDTPSAFPSTPMAGKTNPTQSSQQQDSHQNNQPKNPQVQKEPSQRPSLASSTFQAVFEAKLGNVHFASLENLSMVSSLQSQQIGRKLNPEQKERLQNAYQKLQEAFEPENQTDLNLDLSLLAIPIYTESTSSSTQEAENQDRTKFATQLTALNQRIAFYHSRTQSLQAFALKALQEHVVPENNDIKPLSELTLNYRGKMQLEGIRQVAEFCSLSISQILLAAEFYKEHAKKEITSDDLRFMNTLITTSKELSLSISAEMVASMKTLANAFKAKLPADLTDVDAKNLVDATLKRINGGINSMQLDVATSTSNIQESGKFVLQLLMFLQAQHLASE